MIDEMFTVDLEFRDGRRLHPQFVTQQEAVAYAGRMAQDARIARSEVRLGMDAGSATERDLKDEEPRIVQGVKGMNSARFSKKFPNAKAMERWMDSEEAGNYEIQYIMRA